MTDGGGATALHWLEAVWEHEAPGLADRFSNEIDPLTGMLMLSSTDVVSKCRLLVDQAPITEPGSSDVATSAAQSGAASDRARRPVRHGGRHAVDARLPRASSVRRLGRDDGVPGVARLVDRRHALRAVRHRHADRRPPGRPAMRPGAEVPSSSTAATSSRLLAALADTAPRLMAKIADDERRARRRRAVARAGAALPAQHAGVRPAPTTSPEPNPNRWSRSPAAPRRCISPRRTRGSSASPWRCRAPVLTATIAEACRESRSANSSRAAASLPGGTVVDRALPPRRRGSAARMGALGA